jgi:hypothetical protein
MSPETVPTEAPGLQLNLFVAGDSESSLAAYGNIRLALEMFKAGEFELEVIDVNTAPDRAIADLVLITPALLAPACKRRLIGDLSKWSRVHQFLQSLPRP